jgi:hypothetical protein
MATDQKLSKDHEQKPEPSSREYSFQDGDEVTVLFGYGKVHMMQKQYVDNVLFEGGVARNVPYSVAKHWKQGTRPDGKAVTSRVHIQAILPNTATEDDFTRVTGLKAAYSPEHVAALLNSLGPDKIAAILGPQKSKELASQLGIITK